MKRRFRDNSCVTFDKDVPVYRNSGYRNDKRPRGFIYCAGCVARTSLLVALLLLGVIRIMPVVVRTGGAFPV